MNELSKKDQARITGGRWVYDGGGVVMAGLGGRQVVAFIDQLNDDTYYDFEATGAVRNFSFRLNGKSSGLH